MFHHAIMDAADMRRAASLLALLAGHERARPLPMMELVGRRARGWVGRRSRPLRHRVGGAP